MNSSINSDSASATFMEWPILLPEICLDAAVGFTVVCTFLPYWTFFTSILVSYPVCGAVGAAGVDEDLAPVALAVGLPSSIYVLQYCIIICLALANYLSIHVTKLLCVTWYEVVSDCVIVKGGPVCWFCWSWPTMGVLPWQVEALQESFCKSLLWLHFILASLSCLMGSWLFIPWVYTKFWSFWWIPLTLSGIVTDCTYILMHFLINYRLLLKSTVISIWQVTVR